MVNDFHSLCLVIIYDIETNAYMCYSFGVGGQENDKHFSIYQPDFTLVYPNGKNAYDFYFQDHFEKLFAKLIKI